MRLLLLLSLLLSFGSMAEHRDDWDVVKICHLEWGRSTGDYLKDKGFYLHLAESIFVNAGYKVETYVLPWKRCLKSTEAELIDMVAVAWLTPENTQNMHYPPVLLSGYIAQNHLITTNTGIQNSEPESLQGLRFGSPAINSLPDRIREEYVPLFSSIKYQNTQVLSIKMLLKGRIDVIYSPLDTFLDVYDTLPRDDRPAYKVLQPGFGGQPVGPLIPKNSERPVRQKRLIADYNRSFREMCLDGRLQQIMIEHSEEDGLLTHLQYPDLPDLLTHCTLLLNAQRTNADVSDEQLLTLSGHLDSDPSTRLDRHVNQESD